MKEAIPKDGKVRVNGLNIHYLDWGGDGSPVIGIPGISASCWHLLNLAESLTPQYRIITYDIRGRGDSDKPSHGYNLIAHACDLEAFLNALKLEKVTIFGGSLGGLIGIFFSAHFPNRVSKLILGDIGQNLSGEYSRKLSQNSFSLRLSKTYNSLEDYLSTMAEAIGERNRYIEKAYSYEAEVLADGRVRPKQPQDVILEEFSNVSNYDIEALHPRIKCPTLLLRATEAPPYLGKDPILSSEDAQKVVRNIPNCRVVDIQGTNHSTLFLGNQKKMAEAVLSFLKE